MATLMAALTGGAVRALGGTYSAFELVFFRAAIGITILAPWFVRSVISAGLPTRRLTSYGLRTLFSYIGLVCLFFALANMPIAEVYSLMFTTPLITILLALLMLRQKAHAGTWLACAAGLGGALIILRPGIIEISLAALAALTTAICYSSANTCIKFLARTEAPIRITIVNNVLMLPLAFVPAAFVWITPEWRDVPWIIAFGVANTLGGLFQARGVSGADARVVQPFTFLRLPWAAVVGYWLFAELPGIWTWLGAAVIFGSSYYIFYAEAGRKAR